MENGEVPVRATGHPEHVLSFAFLIRAPGGVVPNCSDAPGQNQGILRGVGSPGFGDVEELGVREANRGRRRKESKWRRVGV